MFCHKCGSQSIEGSVFCQKCGAKLISDDIAQRAVNPVAADASKPATPIQTRITDNRTSEPKKKKSKKLPIILGAVALVIVVIIIAASSGGGTDYVASAQQWEPFRNSQGIDATLAQVVNKYISSSTWNANETGEKEATVTVNGKITADGKLSDITMIISVSPGATDGLLSFKVSSASLDGKSIGENDATEFVYMMFDAYDKGIDNMDDYINYYG